MECKDLPLTVMTKKKKNLNHTEADSYSSIIFEGDSTRRLHISKKKSLINTSRLLELDIIL